MLASPIRLVVTVFAGALMAGTSFLIARQAHFHHLLILPAAILLLGGFATMLRAGSHLKSGVAQQRWPEEQLRPMRCLANSRLYRAVPAGILVVMVVSICGGSNALFWVAFLFSQAFLQVSSAFREPQSNGPSLPGLNLAGAAPLQSQAWGEPAERAM